MLHDNLKERHCDATLDGNTLIFLTSSDNYKTETLISKHNSRAINILFQYISFKNVLEFII